MRDLSNVLPIFLFRHSVSSFSLLCLRYVTLPSDVRITDLLSLSKSVSDVLGNRFKFRSMILDAEKDGPALYKHKKDKRLTRVGKFLRDYHLDELPQLWNVFRGDMSFVGPRPERKYYINQITEQDARYPYLYQIRPGVTSYATLYNGYTDTIEKMLRRLELDLYYLEHRSLWFDIKILANTFLNITFGKRF